MSYAYSLTVIDDDGEIVLEHDMTPDAAVKIIAGAMADLKAANVRGGGNIEETPAKGPRKYKKRKGAPKGHRKSESEEMEEAGSKSRLDPEVTKEIENLLIEGISVAAIHEKGLASAPTIYVIKNRLRKDGRLTE